MYLTCLDIAFEVFKLSFVVNDAMNAFIGLQQLFC